MSDYEFDDFIPGEYSDDDSIEWMEEDDVSTEEILESNPVKVEADTPAADNANLESSEIPADNQVHFEGAEMIVDADHHADAEGDNHIAMPRPLADILVPTAGLPPEIQGAILGFLTKSEQMSARSVCKTWAELVGPYYGRMTDNPRILNLLRKSLFSKMDTLVVEDFSQTKLLRNSKGDVVPAVIKKLEFRGVLNLPESVKMVLDYYSGIVEILSLNQYCLGRIDTQSIASLHFPRLRKLSFDMAIPLDDKYPIKRKGIQFFTHMNNWFRILEKQFPALHAIEGSFNISNMNDKLVRPMIDPTFVNLMPTFLAKFEAFVRRHKDQLKTFYFREELYARQFLRRYRHGMLPLLDWREIEIEFVNIEHFWRYHNKVVGVDLDGLGGVTYNNLKLNALYKYIKRLRDIDAYFSCIFLEIIYTKDEVGVGNRNASTFPVNIKIIVTHNDGAV